MPPPLINRNHDKTQELLSADIDNETDSVQKLEVDTHMGHCDKCRELYENFQYLSQFTRLWPDESISADLEQKVRNNFDGIKIHFGKDPVTKESFTARLVVILFVVLVVFLISSDISKHAAEEKKLRDEANKKALESKDNQSPVVNITIVSPGGKGGKSASENGDENYKISYNKNSKVNINLSSSGNANQPNITTSEVSSSSNESNPQGGENQLANQDVNAPNSSAQNLKDVDEQFQFDHKDLKDLPKTPLESNTIDHASAKNVAEKSSPSETTAPSEAPISSEKTENSPSENYQIARRQIDQNDFKKKHSEIRNLSDEEYKLLYENQSVKQSALLQDLIPEENTKTKPVAVSTPIPEIIHDTEFDFQFNTTKDNPDIAFPTAYNQDHFQNMISDLLNNRLPANEDIHIGEMINSFHYPFVFTPDITHSEPILYKAHFFPCAWNKNNSLLALEISQQYNADKTISLDVIQSEIIFNPRIVQSYKLLGLANAPQNKNSAFNKLKKPILMLFEINLGENSLWQNQSDIDMFTLRFKYLDENQQPASWTKAIFKSEIDTNLSTPLIGVSALAEFALTLANSPQRGTSNYDHAINTLDSIDWPEPTQRKELLSLIKKAKYIDYRVYNKANNLFSNDY